MIIDNYRNSEEEQRFVSEAYIGLGYLLLHIDDEDHDPNKAREYFEKADELENIRAPFQLGYLYEKGIGV